MNSNVPSPPRHRGRVIALHCSGGSATHWSHLAEALRGRHELAAPEHYGSQDTGPWGGEHVFTIDDEAVRSIALIDRCQGDKVHLVGHSYGGGVALNVALARPNRIASMVLYEPTAFHLLRQLGERGADPYIEITGVARDVYRGVITGERSRRSSTTGTAMVPGTPCARQFKVHSFAGRPRVRSTFVH